MMINETLHSSFGTQVRNWIEAGRGFKGDAMSVHQTGRHELWIPSAEESSFLLLPQPDASRT